MSRIKRALVSVSDKTGVVQFARGLVDLGVEILSTGGTARTLAEAGIRVRQVSDYTGWPEMMEGRVKTLHPKIHGAILARRDNPEDMGAAREQGIELIDMVVVNLYPFRETVAQSGVTLAQAVEQIDIGGPAMVRSAAKNHAHVAIVCQPGRYEEVLAEMQESDGELSAATRLRLAVEAFAHTAAYDAAIHAYLASQTGARALPDVLLHAWEKRQDLRYGENPHQAAAFYRDATHPATGLAAARQLHGKELSFNNFLDLDAALGTVADFAEPTAAIFKHTSPCGVASAPTLAQAYRDALECDPLSAFGGIIGFNRAVDGQTAQAILEGIGKYGFMECVIAPGFEAAALDLLKAKRDLRLVEAPQTAADALDFTRVCGGLVAQELDRLAPGEPELTFPCDKPVPQQLLETVRFAWRAAKWVKSNAIVIARDTRTVGIGGGVTSRVDAVRLAVHKAGERAKGAVLASDAFFPKPDAIEIAAEAGVAAIVQPGGSLGDREAVEICNRLGIAMAFTGRRHFRH